MRIAVYHNLPSGGGKRALYEMTRRLAERHQIDVYTLSTADHDFCDLRPYCQQHVVFPFDPLPLARSPLGRLNQGIRSADLLRLRSLERRIAEHIDAGGYDVAFVHNCQYGQSPNVLSFLRTPSAYYCQEPPRGLYEPRIPRPYNTFSRGQRVGNLFDPFPRLYRTILRRLDRKNVRAASRVLVNSHYSGETLYRTYGIFAHVAYLGVDLERFRPLTLPKQDFVLSVGALNPRKGFGFLVRSLALIDRDPRPPLVLVSNFTDERERSYLQSLSSEFDVKLEIRVGVSDQELVRLYNQACLTVYAPIMEPFGFVPIESMACGTPVVGVREAGVRESVVAGVTGLLTERDAAEFAAAVDALLWDQDRLQKFGQQGRAHVLESWTWERSVRDLQDRLIQVGQDTQ